MMTSHPNILDTLITLGNLMPFLDATPFDKKEWELLIQGSLSLLLLHYLSKPDCKCPSASFLFHSILKETHLIPNPIILLSKTRTSNHQWVRRLPIHRELYVLLRDVTWHIYSDTLSGTSSPCNVPILLPDISYYRTCTKSSLL